MKEKEALAAAAQVHALTLVGSGSIGTGVV